jgi:hypothetical protein
LSSAAPVPPRRRSPVARNIVGVARTPSFAPSSTTLSIGAASHFAAPTSGLPRSARSSHAFDRSGAHHTARDWSASSGRITWYMK